MPLGKHRKSFEKINIKNFFDSGVASAVANLNYKEKKEGVACIDLGSKTSKVVVFINDKIDSGDILLIEKTKTNSILFK